MTRRFLHEVHRVYSTQCNRYSKGLSDNPAVAVHVLNTACKDIKVAREGFKGLSSDERFVVDDARRIIMRTADWRALAPAFGAAADLLERASTGEGAAAELCAHMARNYRVMAHDLDRDEAYLSGELRSQAPAEPAGTTFAEAEKLLAARASPKFKVGICKELMDGY